MVFSLNQVKYLPQNSLRTVCKRLIESRLKYCAAVWGSCGETLRHKVQRLQDRALSYRMFRDHGDCLRVQQLIDQQIAVTVFKSLNVCAFIGSSHAEHSQPFHRTFPVSHINTSSGQTSLQIAGYGILFLRMFGPLKQ